MPTAICFTLPHPALLNHTLFLLHPLRRFLLFNSSTLSFRRVATILLPPVRTPPEEWRNEEVVVVLVKKFGLCWRTSFPPALTCASQVSLRIPSSTTTTTNELLSTIYNIPYLNYGSSKCGFFIFSQSILATSSAAAMSVGCHPSSHSIQQDKRYQLSVKV